MFNQALPVWAKGQETATNLCLQFKALCPAVPDATVCVATSGIYNLWINGEFVAYGPARVGKGHFRMDRIPVSHLLTRQENVVVIEVTGFNAFSFEIQKQPSFLQAEILSEGKPVCWTGRDFTARVHPFRRRKTQRYSFQRVLTESYHIPHLDTFFTDLLPGTETLAQTEEKIIIPRLAPYPQYEIAQAEPLFSGIVEHFVPEQLRHDRAWLHVSDEKLTGYPIPELEVYPTAECQHFRFVPDQSHRDGDLAADSYTVYRLPHNMTGMLRFRVTCPAPITLYVTFDEILVDGQVDFLRMECANVLRFDLCAGEHMLQTANVYTMGYLQMTAIGGDCRVETLEMVEYKHPPVLSSPFNAAWAAW